MSAEDYADFCELDASFAQWLEMATDAGVDLAKNPEDRAASSLAEMAERRMGQLLAEMGRVTCE